jgi:hypothetical protein
VKIHRLAWPSEHSRCHSSGRGTRRLASDPDNTTGNAVPAKGGKSALTDQDLTDIVEYPDTIQ